MLPLLSFCDYAISMTPDKCFLAFNHPVTHKRYINTIQMALGLVVMKKNTVNGVQGQCRV